MIDNPYLGLEKVGLNRLHDTHSLKIPVPCGNCSTCIALRQNYYVQRCQMESIGNHLFFFTLTYKNDMLPRRIVNDRLLYYPDFSDVQKMFKRLRNEGLKFSYLVVSEYGSNKHRPHFHGILSVPKCKNDNYHDIMNLEHFWHHRLFKEWRRNYGTDSHPDYQPLSEYIRTPFGSTYDCHYIHPSSSAKGEQDVAFYVTKYVTKSDKWVDRLKSALKLNLKPDDFQEEWYYFKPRCCVSKGFGSYSNPAVKKHIRKGIESAIACKSPFPYFINPISGQTFPLAPTFKKRFLTLKDAFIFASFSEYSDGYHETDEVSEMKHQVSANRLKKVRKQINSRLTTNDFINDSEIENPSEEVLEEFYCSADCSTSLPDDWQSDFDI